MLTSKKGRELVSRMPKERILTESDGPFARLDGQSLVPWDVEKAIDALAEIWSSDRANAERLLNMNLRQLVGE
jgi:TatD DNase family protein